MSPLYKTKEFCLLKHYLQLKLPDMTLRRHMIVKTCKLNSLSLSKPIFQKKKRRVSVWQHFEVLQKYFCRNRCRFVCFDSFRAKHKKRRIVLKSSPVHFNTLLHTQQTAVYEKFFISILNSFSLHPLFVVHGLKPPVQLMLQKTQQ